METNGTFVIVATGFWNGRLRLLVWGQAAPYTFQWLGPKRLDQALVFNLPTERRAAEEALAAASAAMLNKALTVELRRVDGPL